MVQLCSSTRMDTVWKKSRFVESEWSDRNMIDILSVAVHIITLLTCWCSILSSMLVSPLPLFLDLDNHHHHHHHVVPLAQMSLTLSRYFSLSFIASDRFSGLHPVSSHSCGMYVRAERPAFARLYVGVHRSTSLMSSFLLLQQCPACLVHLDWIVFLWWEAGGRIVGALWGVAAWTYSILLETFLCSCCLSSSRVVLLASKWCIHTAVSTRPLLGRNCFIFSVRSDLYMIDSLSIAVHAFVSRVSFFFFIIPLLGC